MRSFIKIGPKGEWYLLSNGYATLKGVFELTKAEIFHT